MTPSIKNAARRALKRSNRLYYTAMFGGSCTLCRATEQLEFDHIERDSRARDYGGSFWELSRPRIEAELKHCQLLCRPCHIKKSVTEDREFRAHLVNPPECLLPHS